MPDALTPVDNGASYAGQYGIANNHYAAWLMSIGHGELLALRPAEFSEAIREPACTAPAEKRNSKTGRWMKPAKFACGYKMRLRPGEFVCYEHKTPVRVPMPPRWQKMPKCPWTPLECIGYEVGLEYSSVGYESRGAWKWLRTPL